MGEKTLNEYFYKPAYKDKGVVEMNKFDAALDVADAEIKANKDLRHSQGSDYSNIVICANFDNPDDAITNIGADNKTLLVTEAETCDVNFEVPANVTVKFERGGKWTINTGVTVTFNGHIDAGLWQIFEYVETGVVTLWVGSTKEVYPQWWGAKGDGVTDDTAAIQSAIATTIPVKIVGTLYTASTLAINVDSICIFGENINHSSIHTLTDDFPVFTIGGETSRSLFTLKELTIQGGTYAIYSNIVAIVERATLYKVNFKSQVTKAIYCTTNTWAIIWNITECAFKACGGGIEFAGNCSNLIMINRCRFESLNASAIITSGLEDFIITGCRFEDKGVATGYSPITIADYGKELEISNNYFENILYPGIFIVNSKNTRITGNHFSSNTGGTTPLQFTGIMINLEISYNQLSAADGAGAKGIIAGSVYCSGVKIYNNTELLSVTGFNEDAFVWTGGQIAFPATQVPSANVNTLDDYKEGNWTAALVCGTSGTIALYADQNTGAYVKIGRQVTVTGRFRVETVSSPVGSLILQTLPFTCGNATKFMSAVSVYAQAMEATAATQIIGFINANTTNIILSHFAAGEIGSMAADIKAGSYITVTATYFTD